MKTLAACCAFLAASATANEPPRRPPPPPLNVEDGIETGCGRTGDPNVLVSYDPVPSRIGDALYAFWDCDYVKPVAERPGFMASQVDDLTRALPRYRKHHQVELDCETRRLRTTRVFAFGVDTSYVRTEAVAIPVPMPPMSPPGPKSIEAALLRVACNSTLPVHQYPPSKAPVAVARDWRIVPDSWPWPRDPVYLDVKWIEYTMTHENVRAIRAEYRIVNKPAQLDSNGIRVDHVDHARLFDCASARTRRASRLTVGTVEVSGQTYSIEETVTWESVTSQRFAIHMPWSTEART